ncbi:hypothetical protein CDO26_27875 (plasmid) [Sinorhizobium meliloti]|uniref:SU10 major capsid protein n=1 Tax=Rhizobium meliloti TaxID=382 RepID=UPI000B49EB79|nr:DUF5309 family protein [Sinorhizobium meliloti]ASP88170.1 hypothetical protein CDO26_27875 [Sinorhizobium meliloti]MQW30011.1 head protein [Sinorhizobium meliloti]
MPTLTTNQLTNAREDLSEVISNITPTITPFTTLIGKGKASNQRHEWFRESLAAPNANNALADGAVAPDATSTIPEKLSNMTQTFAKTVAVSGSAQAFKTVGAKNELNRQLVNKGLEIRRDVEAAFISANPSDSSSTRKLGGAIAWVKTNADVGDTGAVAGYSGGAVGAVTAGTNRPFTEDMLLDALEGIFVNGGTPKKVMTGTAMKKKISSFGISQKQQNAKDKTNHQAVDLYVSDFGTVDLIAHPYWQVSTAVLAFDPELWNAAYARSFEKSELGKTGDFDAYLLTTEVTLECMNEAGNASILDVNS